MALASVGEGAFMCTSKDPIVTASKLGCVPSYLYYSSGLYFSDAKFSPRTKAAVRTNL